MRRRIEQLRQQHPAVRTRYAILFAGSVTAVLAFVWISTLPVRFGGTVSDGSADGGTAAAISAFGSVISPQVDGIQEAYQSVDGLEVVNTPENGQTSNSSNSTDTSGSSGSSYIPDGAFSN